MRVRFYIGMILLLVSYLQLIVPESFINFYSFTFFVAFFILGVILICDGITIRIYSKSLLDIITHNRKTLIWFLIISTSGGLILEGAAQWLGKLWIYPYFNFSKYTLLFIGGFALYWLMIIESYLATKTIFDFVNKGKEIVTKYYKWESMIYKVFGIGGVVLIPLSIFLILRDYIIQGKYAFEITSLSSPISYKISSGYVILIFLGVWFLLEFIEYSKRRTSLLKDILHGYSTPLLAILLGSFILAVIMETQNLLHGYWLYANWPLENIQLFGLPVSMFLAWPLHYIVFLSLFRAMSNELSEEVWHGDTIK